MSVFVYFANLLWEQTKTGLGTPPKIYSKAESTQELKGVFDLVAGRAKGVT